MEKLSLRQKYAPYFAQLAQLSVAAGKIDDTNVYQPGNPNTRKIMDALVADNIAPASTALCLWNITQTLTCQHSPICFRHLAMQRPLKLQSARWRSQE